MSEMYHRIRVGLSLGVILGFLAGFLVGAENILTNNYLRLGMWHLSLLSLRAALNRGLFIFTSGAVVLLFLSLIAARRRRRAAGSAVGWEVRLAVILMVVFATDLLLRRFTPYTLLMVGSRAIDRIGDLLAGRISLGSFWSFLGLRIVPLAILAGGLGIIAVLYLLRRRLGIPRFLRSRFSGRSAGKRPAGLALVLLAITAAVNALVPVLERQPAHSGPSVILISIDTLRADRLGCYGYGRDTTPALDRLAREAVRFQNTVTPRAMTTPSVVSIFTGLYPRTHGVRMLCEQLKREAVTLQEILRENGFRTAAVVGNWFLKDRLSGLGQGFGEYNDRMTSPEIVPDVYENRAPEMTALASRWLELNRNRRFFLWVHYQDPHGPYVAPEAYGRLFPPYESEPVPEELIPPYQHLPRFSLGGGKADLNAYRSAYDAEVRFCDDHVGKLLERVKELGLWDDVIIVVTADHGESLGEHDYYLDHGRFVYDTSSRVPLFIRGPGLEVGRVIEAQVNLMSIAPTILDMLGYSPPEEMEGKSLLPLMRGEAAVGDPRVFIERENLIKAVRTDRWKYIANLYRGSAELYELGGDPGEEKNVVEEREDVARSLRGVLEEWLGLEDRTRLGGPQEGDLRSRDRRALRALGYL